MPDNKRNGAIRVTLAYETISVIEIPIRLQIRNSRLRTYVAGWLKLNEFTIPEVIPGYYVISISFAGGISQEQTIEVQSGEIKKVTFDMFSENHLLFEDYLLLTKRNFRNIDRFLHYLQRRQVPFSWFGFTTKLVYFENGRWINKEFPNFPFSTTLTMPAFNLRIGSGLYALEMNGHQSGSKITLLPPGDFLFCWLNISSRDNRSENPIEITVATDNLMAEAMLTQLTQGPISEATAVWSIEEAISIFTSEYEHFTELAAAGYYLVRSGITVDDLKHNLEYKLRWIPDMCVIYAWMQYKDASNLNLFHDFLIEAVDNGLPVYTEGLRLLYEGLEMLASSRATRNRKVTRALSLVRQYVEKIDWSQETTTLIDYSLGNEEDGAMMLDGDYSRLKYHDKEKYSDTEKFAQL